MLAYRPTRSEPRHDMTGDVDSEVPCRVGVVVSVSASHTVGRGLASRPGHNQDHHKNGTNCLFCMQALVRVRF